MLPFAFNVETEIGFQLICFETTTTISINEQYNITQKALILFKMLLPENLRTKLEIARSPVLHIYNYAYGNSINSLEYDYTQHCFLKYFYDLDIKEKIKTLTHPETNKQTYAIDQMNDLLGATRKKAILSTLKKYDEHDLYKKHRFFSINSLHEKKTKILTHVAQYIDRYLSYLARKLQYHSTNSC